MTLIDTVIVDDSSVARQMYRFILANLCRAELIPDAEQALDYIRKNKPKILITDQNMPGMKGTELAARIKGDPSLRSIKVILSSSQAGLPSVNTDAYIIKPTESRVLRQTIIDCVAQVIATIRREEELKK